MFLRWFTEPVRSSWSDPPAASYTPSFTDPRSGRVLSFPSLSSPASLHLSLIIPAYNESARLPKMMEATLSYLSRRRSASPSFTYELIVVDDGSRDETYNVALRYSQQEGSETVRVMRLGRNQGKGGAVQQGMMHARGEWLLMVDADGATRIDDLEKLEKAVADCKAGDSAIAVGSRAHLAEAATATVSYSGTALSLCCSPTQPHCDPICFVCSAQRAWYRTILMHGFHFAVSTLCVRDIRDTQCGFKLFSRQAALLLFPLQHLRRWCFDVELLFLAQRLRLPVREVAVNWEEVPGSKLQLLESSLLMARDLCIIRACYATGVWSMDTTRRDSRSGGSRPSKRK